MYGVSPVCRTSRCKLTELSRPAQVWLFSTLTAGLMRLEFVPDSAIASIGSLALVTLIGTASAGVSLIAVWTVCQRREA